MSIEEVRALVAERQRYDDWLAALEAKRADTPQRVFDRVHGDYLGRRTEVVTRLQSHVGELSALGNDLEQRLTDLESRLAAHEEELAEGMLRNLVGEYDNDRWETVRQDVEAKIASLGSERDVLLAEVDDVRTLLSSARVTPISSAVITADAEETVAAAVATPTPVVTPLVEETVVGLDAVPAEAELIESVPSDAVEGVADVESFVPTVAEEAPASPVADVPSVVLTPMAASPAVEADDESLLDFDVSGLVENPVPQGPSHEDVLADVAALFDTSSIAAVPEPEATHKTAGSAPVSQSEVDDALAMFGEVDGPADQNFVQSLQGIEAEHTPRVDRSIATATPPAAPMANDPFDDLAFLRSVIDPDGAGSPPPAAAAAAASAPSTTSGEPQKTLRCTECGTMNLPTEWYCERCGGELAAF